MLALSRLDAGRVVTPVAAARVSTVEMSLRSTACSSGTGLGQAGVVVGLLGWRGGTVSGRRFATSAAAARAKTRRLIASALLLLLLLLGPSLPARVAGGRVGALTSDVEPLVLCHTFARRVCHSRSPGSERVHVLGRVVPAGIDSSCDQTSAESRLAVYRNTVRRG